MFWTWLLKIFRPFAQILIPLVFDLLFNKVMSAVREWKRKREEAKSAKEANKKYSEKVDDENATREERKDAEDKFLNS